MTTHTTNDHQKAHEVARVLKRYMHANALTQSDLARRTGVKRDNISRYCRAMALPAMSMAARIEKYTGLNLTEILNRGPDGRPDSTLTIDRLPDGNYAVRMTRDLTPAQLHQFLKIVGDDAPPEQKPVYEEQLTFAE